MENLIKKQQSSSSPSRNEKDNNHLALNTQNLPAVENLDVDVEEDSVTQAARDVFAMFDKDGGGSIDISELGQMFEFVGKKSSEKEL